MIRRANLKPQNAYVERPQHARTSPFSASISIDDFVAVCRFGCIVCCITPFDSISNEYINGINGGQLAEWHIICSHRCVGCLQSSQDAQRTFSIGHDSRRETKKNRKDHISVVCCQKKKREKTCCVLIYKAMEQVKKRCRNAFFFSFILLLMRSVSLFSVIRCAFR